MPIPEWYKPIPGADPEAFAQAVDRQLELAQREYDPTGTFAQRRDASWFVDASRDTRGITSLPAIYQSENTNITVQAFTDDEGAIEVALGVRTDSEAPADYYHAHTEEELPIIVALLGRIANVELAELETHPRRAIRALGESAGASIGLERYIAQKTLELPDAPGDAINVTYFKMTGSLGVTNIRLARQVELPEGTFLYQQYISRDDRDPDTLYCWPRAFRLTRHMPMGEGYFGARIRGPELANRSVPGEISKGFFEAQLKLAGNAFVGVVEAAGIDRVVSEPISPQYRLHA